MSLNKIEFGDCRETMRRWAAGGARAQTCVTRPPYFGLRDYGHEGQLGLEQTPDEYIAALVEPCILAGSRPGGTVLDPFMGSGTTAAVALQHGRKYLGCELNSEYGPLQQERITAAGAERTKQFLARWGQPK